MSDTSPDADASSPPRDAPLLDAWLQSRLDHCLTVVLLASHDDSDTGAEQRLAVALAPLQEARLRVERLARPNALSAAMPDEAALEHALLRIELLAPDVLLVEHHVTAGDNRWSVAVLRVADRLGLCDRALVALYGAGVTRVGARRLGFEDGYPLDMPAATLVATLAREAVARDELRRHGSSPPCYL